MTELELKFVKYFNKLTIDGIIFSNNILDELETNDINELQTDINLECIKEILDEISYGHYPKSIIENTGILINYIKENCTENKETIEELNNSFNNLKETPTDEKLYLYEAFYKVLDSTYLPHLDYIEVDEESIRESIKFDSYTMYTLVNEEMEILNTELYLYSIRKFLIEMPEMFQDKKINKRALEILEKNKNIEGTDRLIHKIKHIDKFMENNFTVPKYKALYDYIVLQNMLNNNTLLKQYSNRISTDIIATLFSIIEEDLIKDEKNRKNALEILAMYREYIYENATKEEQKEYLKKHNKYLSILNSKTNFSDEMVYSECKTRINGTDTLKYTLKPLDIDNLIIKDLQILGLYMSDDKQYIKRKQEIEHEDIYLCINKFISIMPSIFDDETIYKRTLDLLDTKNVQTTKTKNKVKKIYEGR